jgi:heat-inducible transcriptional repressor
MPEEESFILKNVTLVPLEGNRVLALWVSTAGFTRSCLIDMGEKLPSEELERLYQFLNKELRGLSYSEIKCHAAQKLQASRDSLRSLYQKACQVIENSLLDSPPEKIFMEGSSKMLEQPEFQRLEEIRPILTGLEEKKVIQGLMRETLQAEALTVRIGSETGNDLFRECSLISIPYYHGSHVMGALGILGPKRMRYGEVMALVTQVSRWVAEGFERWFE